MEATTFMRYGNLTNFYQQTIANTYSCSKEIRDCLNAIELSEWWGIVLQFPETEIRKTMAMSIIGFDMTSQAGQKDFVVQSQAYYNGLKLSDPKLKTILEEDEKALTELLPPESGLCRFFNKRGKVKSTFYDLWLQYCFHLWFSIRTYCYLTSNSETSIINKEVMSALSNAIKFFSFHVSFGNEEQIECVMELSSFFKTPEGFLFAYGFNSPITQTLFLLIDYWYCLKREDRTCEIISEKNKFIQQFAKDNNITIDIPPISEGSDFLRNTQSTISDFVSVYIPNISLDDDRLRTLFSDMESFYVKKKEKTPAFFDYYPKVYSLYRRLYHVTSPAWQNELDFLFFLLNTHLLHFKEKTIVDILGKQPFNKYVQRRYESYCFKNPGNAREFKFADVVHRLLSSDDFKWDAPKSSSCFNIPWNRYKIQRLYDSLRKSYIDRETDVRDFCYALTGCKPASTWEVKKVNWSHKDKQSLALFVGELVNRDSNGIKWSAIPKVFLHNGEEVYFHSSTQCGQARKSGKYDDLLKAILEAEALKVDIDKII